MHAASGDSIGVGAARVFGLCGFAFAAPIFDLFGRNATFFVAHDSTAGEILLFTAVLLLVPPAVLLGVIIGARAVSPAAGRWATTVVVGALVALTIVPAVNRSTALSTPVYVVLLVGCTTGAAALYRRFTSARTFTMYLAPMPLLFAFVFLFTTPVSTLVTGGDEAVAAEIPGGRRTPVVMLVLDELPLGGLLDARGEIDAQRFPGFAALAELSTWYPNATTVAPYTHQAVPALLTGTLKDSSEVPVAATFPRSLFTMLGASHELWVEETTTRLCPTNLCRVRRPYEAAPTGLANDTTIAYLRTVLPAGLADGVGVPAIDEGWAGFGDAETPSSSARSTARPVGVEPGDWGREAVLDGRKENEPRFRRFLASIGGTAARLSYAHLSTPHAPWRFLPDGTRYNGAELMPGMPDWTHWSDDEEATDLGRQRFVLQLQWADSMVVRLVERLRDSGLLDSAMVVVTSDHGASFQADAERRGVPLDDANKHEVLPVPLFVKYPGRSSSSIDTTPVQTVDVLPTIADALALRLPDDWTVEGQSMLDARDRSPHWIAFGSDFRAIDAPTGVDATVMSRRIEAVLGPSGKPNDVYALGPSGDLVGRPLAAVRGTPATGHVTVHNADMYRAVRLHSGFLPALLVGEVAGVDPDAWVAVSVNGTIAGNGPVLGDDTVSVVLDPQYFTDGANTVRVHVVDPDGRTVHTLPTG